jgi:hypothetical protein
MTLYKTRTCLQFKDGSSLDSSLMQFMVIDGGSFTALKLQNSALILYLLALSTVPLLNQEMNKLKLPQITVLP